MPVTASDTFFKVHLRTPTGACLTVDEDSIPDTVIDQIYNGHIETASVHLSEMYGLPCTVAVEIKVSSKPSEE